MRGGRKLVPSTRLQVNRYDPIGSGLLSIQSVNLSFVTVMIALGGAMKKDGLHEELIVLQVDRT